MLKNKIIILVLSILLITPSFAEEAVQLNTAEHDVRATSVVEDFEVNTNEVQGQSKPEKFQYKQVKSKKSVAKNFILAMMGVLVSSILIYVALTLYNKIREISLRNNECYDDDTTLEKPDDITDAIKIFLDKTK